MEQKKPHEPDPPKLIVDQRSILRFAEKHYDVHANTPEMRWNGRQIRNAFQIAYSLAELEMLSLHEKNRGDGTGRLDARHFQRIARTSQKFEEYFSVATEGTDADRARKQRIRRDDYEDRTEPPSYPGYGPPGHRPGAQYGPGPSGHAYDYGLRPFSPPDPYEVSRPVYGRPGTSHPSWPDRDQGRSREQAPLAARPAQRSLPHRQLPGGDDNARGGRAPQPQPLSPNPPGSATSPGSPGRAALQPPPRTRAASARNRTAPRPRSQTPSQHTQGRRPATPPSQPRQQRQQPPLPRHQQAPSLTITACASHRPSGRDNPQAAFSGRGAGSRERWPGDAGEEAEELDEGSCLDDELYDDRLSDGFDEDEYDGEEYDDGGFYGEGSAYGDPDEFLDDRLDGAHNNAPAGDGSDEGGLVGDGEKVHGYGHGPRGGGGQAGC
ncbi:hypothetical protein VTJ83DRAFT_6153 [Remersonia thermophila]|uniref:AAA+ ATPase lid domain-containing protein n=1 Tax=Remersonia thermophila TaxID=72144 RepID=A0ABR4D8X6_9PEZI